MMCLMLRVLLTGVTCFGYVSSAQAFRSEEGPYQTTIVNMTSCVEQPAWFSSNISAHTSKGRSLIRGVLSYPRDIKEPKFRVVIHYLDGKKVKVKVFDMKNQNCHNAIIELLLQTVRVPFNKQNCNMKAGTYEFRDLNMDAILHTVVQSMWYGNAVLRLEAGSRKQPMLCLDLHFQIHKPERSPDSS